MVLGEASGSEADRDEQVAKRQMPDTVSPEIV